jgi:hypothetical protein
MVYLVVDCPWDQLLRKPICAIWSSIIAGRSDMKSLIRGAGLCIFLFSLPLAAQVNTRMDPFMRGPGGVLKSGALTSGAFDFTSYRSPKRPGHYALKDWRALVDSVWGPGLPTSTKLQIFDYFWNLINTSFAGFPYLDVNWDSLKALYRPEVAAGVSRGRFQAILGQMYLPLCEVHTYIADAGLDSSFMEGDKLVFKPGVPMFWTNGWGPAGNFGAALTPLPDSSLLVYRAIFSHPLGLVPGDIVLGYDRIPWKQLYRDLLAAQLPFEWWDGPFGSTKRSMTYSLLNSAGNNWSLFDSVDVVKYASGDTVHLPTAPLAALDWFSLYATDQVPVPGVPMPDLANGGFVSHGTVDSIGYVYVARWNAADASPFSTAVADLVTVKKVRGLILDFRYNLGSADSRIAADGGLDYLFGHNPAGLSRWQNALRNTTGDHFSFSYAPPFDQYVSMQPDSFSGPVAVLTGPHARSFGDLNAFKMRSFPKVRFFGLPTNGSFPVPGKVPFVENQWGNWYYQHASGQMQSLINNEGLLMHKGFPVDEEVWLTRDGVAKGEDDVVGRAIAWIKAMTGVAEDQPNLPSRFMLIQNYPNPFNPTTVVSYQLPVASTVKLWVYDLLGREVAVLVNERREPGVHEVKFDGSNLASGVYLCRLQAGSYVQTRKLLLLK